ncbi:MAG: phosphate ABC transporter permease PstA [Alphaproteobacteria bacterium]|jgi:phosphate transport system permease protein|nr:phosphate ABC transporter permease PstA [Alphaproteobacteria bacterium]
MTDLATPPRATSRPNLSTARLKRRYRAETRFRIYGIAAIATALLMLAFLLGSIIHKGAGAFMQTEMSLSVPLKVAELDPEGTRDPVVLSKANYRKIVRTALRERFPEVSGRKNTRELAKIISSGSDLTLRNFVLENPERIGSDATLWFKTSADIDQLSKGNIPRDVPEADRRVSDKQIAWFDQLNSAGETRLSFNTTFFTSGDSREPEQAGVWGAVVGTALTLIVTLILSFPIGVMSAVYLEEFAPKNRWTDLIEVNINNLAAVPSIVFGLLGLAVFLNFFGLPRSAPLVGGLVLALMTLPTVIIAARAAMSSVPPSIREAALGVGASPLQTVTHHVLPLAMPGILTGTIIGMARALGETAPLLMIGMVAFIVDIPRGFTDAATVLPVQVFLWADAPERAFVERTSAAIMVLLAFLILMNLAAVLLRRKFERRW